MREQAGQPDCEKAFQDIEQKHDDAGLGSGSAMDIRSTDVAAAHGTDVGAQGEPDEPVAEGKTSDEISEESGENHDAFENG